jgi:hypothetical protein
MAANLAQDQPELIEYVWEPQPGPQTWLLECPVEDVLFGGARGGGKSDAVLGEWAAHADEYGEDAIGLCVRRERTQLKELIERSIRLYKPLGASFNTIDKMWRFPNGARLTFAYLENDNDAMNYQGHSYTRVYVEEMGTFADPAPIDKLAATLRSGANVPCRFIATANPGGPGHLWIKQRYVDPAPLGLKILHTLWENPFTGEKITRSRVFIPSKVTDNKYTNTSTYIGNLFQAGTNNPELVKAWLIGDWNVMLGAFFHEWDTNKHVIREFKIPKSWTRFMSFDFGSSKPFSVGWWAIVPDEFDFVDHFGYSPTPMGWAENKPIRLPKGAIVRYREYYGAKKDQAGRTIANVGLKLTIEQIAEKINLLERTEPKNEFGRPRLSYRVADPSIFKEEGGPSIAEKFAQKPYHIEFRPADNKRVGKLGMLGGWQQVRSRLVGSDGRPMIYFMDNCPEAIRTLPALQHDEDNKEDVDTNGEDHAPDEIRYACMSRPYHISPGSDVVRSMIRRNSNAHGIVINDDLSDIEYGGINLNEGRIN